MSLEFIKVLHVNKHLDIFIYIFSNVLKK